MRECQWPRHEITAHQGDVKADVPSRRRRSMVTPSRCRVKRNRQFSVLQAQPVGGARVSHLDQRPFGACSSPVWPSSPVAAIWRMPRPTRSSTCRHGRGQSMRMLLLTSRPGKADGSVILLAGGHGNCSSARTAASAGAGQPAGAHAAPPTPRPASCTAVPDIARRPQAGQWRRAALPLVRDATPGTSARFVKHLRGLSPQPVYLVGHQPRSALGRQGRPCS